MLTFPLTPEQSDFIDRVISERHKERINEKLFDSMLIPIMHRCAYNDEERITLNIIGDIYRAFDRFDINDDEWIIIHSMNG